MILPGPFRKFPDIWLSRWLPSLEELLYDIIRLTSCLPWLRATQRSSADLDAKMQPACLEVRRTGEGSLSWQHHAPCSCLSSRSGTLISQCVDSSSGTRLFTSDHRGIKSTRMHFSPAVSSNIISATAVFLSCGWFFFLPVRFARGFQVLHLSNADAVEKVPDCFCRRSSLIKASSLKIERHLVTVHLIIFHYTAFRK